MDEDKKGYGEFFRRHRLASGYKSLRSIAKATGINVSTISRIEKEQHRPEQRTIKNIAPYLTTTSLVELMVVFGYWDEDELLEPINYDPKPKETPSHQAEKEFVKKLELSDEKLLKEFDLELDGKRLTDEEAKGVIAYLRSLRSIDE